MKRVAALILFAGIFACKKHEDATVRAEATVTPAPVDSTTVAAATPSATASAVATAAPSASADVARQEALEAAREFGMLGLLQGDAAAPSFKTLGDGGTASIFGDLNGDPIGDALGHGGLGLQGTGAGGGQGEGIGLGNIGTIGHGSGTGTGSGYGRGSGRLGGGRTSSPKIRVGQATVNGRLPPEVIRRIVRQNFGRFRLCYEQGLLKDPKLSGMVATKFVIDTQGAVSTAARDASTTMSDATVVSCVTHAFSSLSFPQPEGGIVVVVYPLDFEPGE